MDPTLSCSSPAVQSLTTSPVVHHRVSLYRIFILTKSMLFVSVILMYACFVTSVDTWKIVHCIYVSEIHYNQLKFHSRALTGSHEIILYVESPPVRVFFLTHFHCMYCPYVGCVGAWVQDGAGSGGGQLCEDLQPGSRLLQSPVLLCGDVRKSEGRDVCGQ